MYKQFPVNVSKNGIAYPYPEGLTEEQFYAMLDELLDFCKIKGLTVKQAKMLLKTGAKYVVDSTMC